jgi:F-type H+-transporting ATPase subunit gamma
MSKRHEIKSRIATLTEIKGILNAMKNLALLEIRKLDIFLTTQQRAVSSIETASLDFLTFYSQPPQLSAESFHQLWIIIGSERGFCGDFNKALHQFVQSHAQQENRLLLVVGNRLRTKFQDDQQVVAFLDGHSVTEEIHTTLLHLTEVLNSLHQQFPLKKIGSISAVYYDDETCAVKLRQLIPLAASQKRTTFSNPPTLNLEPSLFWSQLTDHFLYAALHEAFYTSLMVENQMRLEHMEKAIQRLEKNEIQLSLDYNKVRQEEIIEEIEVILLSAEALSETSSSE